MMGDQMGQWLLYVQCSAWPTVGALGICFQAFFLESPPLSWLYLADSHSSLRKDITVICLLESESPSVFTATATDPSCLFVHREPSYLLMIKKIK